MRVFPFLKLLSLLVLVISGVSWIPLALYCYLLLFDICMCRNGSLAKRGIEPAASIEL
jgi:hypothetical protein